MKKSISVLIFSMALLTSVVLFRSTVCYEQKINATCVDEMCSVGMSRNIKEYTEVEDDLTSSESFLYAAYIGSDGCSINVPVRPLVSEKGHTHAIKELVIEPTCTSEGKTSIVCEICGCVVEEQILPQLNHTMSDWYITAYASPDTGGQQERVCDRCGYKEVITYEFYMEDNSVYIPGVLQSCFTVASFTQEDVDSYSVVYAHPINYPDYTMILGHNYWGLGSLYKTQVGQYIYVKKDGVISRYKVAVSEQGTDIRTDIIGTTCNLFSGAYPAESIRLYTCYNNSVNTKSRWFVIAVPA